MVWKIPELFLNPSLNLHLADEERLFGKGRDKCRTLQYRACRVVHNEAS